MSAKCQWCHRKRPEGSVEVDGRSMDVCTNCAMIISGLEQRGRDEKAAAKKGKHQRGTDAE